MCFVWINCLLGLLPPLYAASMWDLETPRSSVVVAPGSFLRFASLLAVHAVSQIAVDTVA